MLAHASISWEMLPNATKCSGGGDKGRGRSREGEGGEGERGMGAISSHIIPFVPLVGLERSVMPAEKV